MKTLERFLSRVKKVDSGCWLWEGYIDITGYGVFWLKGQNRLAHRASWQIFHPDIPLGDKHVLHKCDVKNCVNPDHLFLGTELDNHRDKANKGRSARGERNAESKLTNTEVMEIRSLYPIIKSHRKLATKYCVSKACITRILSGKGWKHLL